jgi:hypothetical protein
MTAQQIKDAVDSGDIDINDFAVIDGTIVKSFNSKDLSVL